MGETSDFDAAQVHAVILKLNSGLAGALGSPDGSTIELDAPETERMEDVALRALIPDAAAVAGLKDGDGESSFLLILDRQAARSLALGALDLDEESRASRLEGGAKLEDDERAALAEIAERAAGAAKTALGIEHATLPVDHLENSVWESGGDPIGSGAMVVAKATLRIDGRESGQAYIAITPSLAASSGGSTDGLLCFASKPELSERMLASLGVAARTVANLPDLVASFADEAVEAAVIGVAAGDEYVLATVASLREYPGCGKKSVVVVLEEPSAWNVVRCGRLGLFSVLGPEFTADDLARKLDG